MCDNLGTIFESEDFDLDGDFLKDIGEKEEEYYSQRVETSVDPPAKRRKSEPLAVDPFDDITFDDEPDFPKIAPKSPSTRFSQSEITDVSLRKRRILEIFNSGDDSSKSEKVSQPFSQLSHQSQKKSPRSSSSSISNLEASRNNSALEILRRGSQNLGGNLENRSPQESSDSWLKTTDRNSEAGSSDISEEMDEKIETLFRKPAVRTSPRKFAAKNSPKFRAAPRVTIVRKFPGPAGLLPDNPESNFDHANFLNGLDDRAIDDDHEDLKITDYCSQNTERLFSSGAWRSMLDDLPANFLKGHEIATVKRSARESRKNSKVSFVAGLVERIDLSVDNPPLVLKDMTDSIEASMHSDVNLQYPNIIEPGVVVLLRGAGLLVYQGSRKWPGLHYHLMITPRNLVAVYSEKARLISSPWMESMKKNLATTPDDSGDSGEIDKNDENVSSPRKQRIWSERNSGVSEAMEIGDLTEEDDMASACFNLGDIKDSQIASSVSKAEPQAPTKFLFGRNRGKAVEKKNSVSEQPEVDQRGNKSPTDKNTEQTKKKSESEISPAAKIEIRPKPIHGVSARLRQFRSDDVLTPPVGDNLKRDDVISSSTRAGKTEAAKDDKDDGESILGTFGDDLLASDNDTEDEILSQVDVDAIMTNYNAST